MTIPFEVGIKKPHANGCMWLSNTSADYGVATQPWAGEKWGNGTMSVATLAQQVEPSSVSFDDLEVEYRPMLALVRELIGVVPNCDPVLEIWPPGFRSYNLLVPNLLNLPGSLLGQGAAKDLVGLGMYVSSRAAECMYCSAHTCSFALRRGASAEAITGTYNEVEQAVADVAEAMGAVPSFLQRSHIAALEEHLDESEIEWVVHGIALMGFLNKFMDTMGIELEGPAIEDVEALIGPTGWEVGKHGWNSEVEFEANGALAGKPLQRKPSADTAEAEVAERTAAGFEAVPVDSMATYLRVFRQAPAAIRLERQWTKGISGRVGPALMALESQVGYSFPILASLQHSKPVKAIATALRDNLDPELSALGLDTKVLVGLVYARVVGNEMLAAEAIQLAELLAPELDHRLLAAVSKFAAADSETAVLPPGLDSIQAAAIMLAKVGSTSPSEVNEITIEMAADALTAEQIVETVVWISVQQLLHRLYVFYDAFNEID